MQCPISRVANRWPHRIAIIKTMRSGLPDETITYAALNTAICHYIARTQSQEQPNPVRLYPHISVSYLIQMIGLIRQGYCLELCGVSPSQAPPQPVLPRYYQSCQAKPAKASYQTWPMTTPATIVYTSGSSATPKAVVHTMAQHYWGARGASGNISAASRLLLTLPLYHVSGLSLIIRCFLAGATLVIPAAKQPLHQLLRQTRATHCSVVLQQLVRLLETDCDYPDLKQLLFGGSACPPAIQARATHLPIVYSYGLTEMGGQVAVSNADNQCNQPGLSVLPYRQVYCHDNQIYVSGRCLSLGYLTQDDTGWHITQATYNHGYISTRDTGYTDDDNQVYITGRLDAMFISGGENIQPHVIESVLLTHPDIITCCVVPQHCDRYGHRPVAFIYPYKPPSADWVKHRLHAYWRPVAYYHWPASQPLHKPKRPQLSRLADLAK